MRLTEDNNVDHNTKFDVSKKTVSVKVKESNKFDLKEWKQLE